MCRISRSPFVVGIEAGAARAYERRDWMPQYLLALHTVEGEASEPMTGEQMEEVMRRISELEQEMESADALLFSGRLQTPESATVVSVKDGRALRTDGPFAETKEQIGGFYIVNAADLDDALGWAEKTSSCIGKPIEVRPFLGMRTAVRTGD
jgi:hypothetical protein